jgi:hypothetical protein
MKGAEKFWARFSYRKKSESTWVRRHLICELNLKEYCHDISIVVITFDVDVCLIGPHVFPHRLSGNHYEDFLLHDLSKLLEDVPLAVRTRMWCMHDGAPAHFSRAVRDVLNNTCHDRWIGRVRPSAWPPSSPDLNPLNLLPVGTPKHLCVCSSC